MKNRFQVIPAPAFINSGPALGSTEYREAIQQEQLRNTQRLARQQRQIDKWQARKAQMTEREIIIDELSMFNEMTKHSAENLARLEAAFQKITNGRK